RLTVTMGSNDNYKLSGVAAGASTLTLAASDPNIQPVPAALPVSVQTFVPALPTFASTLYVGDGLQASVPFRYDPTAAGTVTIAVDDASVALVSSSPSTRGGNTLTLQSSVTGSDQYTFYVQGQGSTGATILHVRFPEGERTFTVSLLPSGAGFTAITSPPT